MPLFVRATVGAALWRKALLVLACTALVGCELQPASIGVRLIETGRAGVAGDETRFEIDLAGNYIPASLIVHFDGKVIDVEPTGVAALVRSIALAVPATGGQHVLTLRARFLTTDGIVTRIRRFPYMVPTFVQPGAVTLLSSWPKQGTRNVSHGEWMQLEFSAPPPPEFESAFALRCGGRQILFQTYRVSGTYWLLNPVGQLPAQKLCVFQWIEFGAPRRFVFGTAAAGVPAYVEYDRERPGLSSPFPDDYYTRVDRTSPTRKRIELPVTEAGTSLDAFAMTLDSDVRELDGFSPVGHVFVALSDPVDLLSLPHGPEESVHPASAVQMFDVDPGSHRFGRRIPFNAETREDLDAHGNPTHSLLLFPVVPLNPGGRVAVVLTRALRASQERAFQPSPFMQRVLKPRHPDDTDAVRRARRQSGSALWVVENVASPPLPRDDMALIASFTIGTLEGLSRDLLHMRSQVQRLPLPEFSIDHLEHDADDGSTTLHGTWQAPSWRNGDNVARDVNGLPTIVGTEPIAFTLSLPPNPRDAGAPLVLYQHGNPGDAETEVPIEARRSLAAAGFAVLGFTDVFNRELAGDARDDTSIVVQLAESLLALGRRERLPDYWLVTNAEQLAFLRLARALGELDVLPFGRVDGNPDLDVDAPLAYLGLSAGANHAPGFLPYAPEVRSAALVAGGAPIVETLVHQIDVFLASEVSRVLMGGEGRDLWLGLSLLQTAIDRQDPFHHARFLYRDPVPVAGDVRKASVLLYSGIEDSRIPNRFSDALAWLLGPIPMLDPALRHVDFLPSAEGPLRGNIDAATTAAYVQVVPAGLAGAEVKSGCDPTSMSSSLATDGHFCAQVSPDAIEQRLRFFLSALGTNAPVVSSTSMGDEPTAPAHALPETGS